MSDLPEIDALLARVPARAALERWEIYKQKMHGFDLSVVSPTGDAELGNWLVAGVRWEEQARLIAIAPDLATALRALRAEVERHSATISDLTRERDAQREALADHATKFDVIGAYVETGGGQQLSHAKIYEWATAARKLAALSTTKGGADA